MSARILKNHRGSTLILVILVFALLIILATAALAVAESSHVSSVNDWQNQQAYFTARSAVLAAADYFKQHPELNIEDYVGIPGASNTTDGMGSYHVTITKLDEKRFQIASTADFQGRTRTVRAIVAKAENAFPFGQNLLTATYFNNVKSTMNGGLNIHGDLMINDKTAFNAGVTITGNLYVVGPVTITGHPKLLDENNDGKGGNLYSTGDVTFSNTIDIAGSVFCKGSVIVSNGNMNFLGNNSLLYVGKDLVRSDNGVSILTPKDIVVWGNGNLNIFNNYFIKTKSNRIYFKGLLLIPNPKTSYLPVITENYNPELHGHKMPDLTYDKDFDTLKTLIDVSEYKAGIELWKNKKITVQPSNWGGTFTIKESCTPVSGSTGGTLLVDTSISPINLYFDKTNCKMFKNQQLTLKVSSTNNPLIIHLAEGVEFESSGSGDKYFGLVGSASTITKDINPMVYIVAPYSTNKIWFYNAAAFVIMPYGDLTLSGGGTFVGNMITASSQMQGNNMFYKSPNYPDIPGVGKIEVTGGGSSGGVSLVGVYTNQ